MPGFLSKRVNLVEQHKKGHLAIQLEKPVNVQMPTGTGKTITLLSLITSYQLAHPEVGKLIYCTRTVPEMEKVLQELKELVDYRDRWIFPCTPAAPFWAEMMRITCLRDYRSSYPRFG